MYDNLRFLRNLREINGLVFNIITVSLSLSKTFIAICDKLLKCSYISYVVNNLIWKSNSRHPLTASRQTSRKYTNSLPILRYL